MIIIVTHCSTADLITVTHYRLLSSNATYCRLLSPRATPRPIKVSPTIDSCRAMRLTANYYRHALLHARSITVTHCRLLSSNATYCRLLSPRATPRPIKVSLTIDCCRLLSPRAFFLVPFCFSEKQSAKLICRITAICFFLCSTRWSRLFPATR